MVQVASLIPAKRTVTDIRKLYYRELLGHLHIANGDLSEIIINAVPGTASSDGIVTIVTKTEMEA